MASAQTDPALEQGLKQFGSYHGGDLDTVNLANGKIALRIPIWSFPQRGKLHLNYMIEYGEPTYTETCRIASPEIEEGKTAS